MPDTPHRIDSWVQVALLLLALFTMAAHMESRVARIEQALTDDAVFHADETRRLESLEWQFRQWAAPHR